MSSRPMLNLMLGLAMVAFSAVSIRDGMRITTGFRAGSSFDVLGPDRYLLGVAVLVGALGLGFIIQSVVRIGKDARARERAVATEEGRTSGRHIVLIGLLLIYAALMPILGYAAASFLFFIVTFRVMGLDRWKAVLPWSLAATAAYYLAFVNLADMPLPPGVFGN